MSTYFSKLLLLFIIPTVFQTNKHPFHVSTIEIAQNTKTNSLEVTCRIFTDDFESVLSKRFKSKIDLSSKNKEKEMNTFIKSYLESSLKFNIDTKTIKPSYVGFENDHEATNVYLEIDNVTSFKQLNLSNSILYDLFEDQLNILHVEKDGGRKSTKVSFPEKQMKISF